jgi:hypothetical protein
MSELDAFFFQPTPRKDYNAAESGFGFDDFTWYHRTQMQRPEGPFDDLVYTYVLYARTLSNKCEFSYECLMYASPFLPNAGVWLKPVVLFSSVGHRAVFTRAIYHGREIADIEYAEGLRKM